MYERLQLISIIFIFNRTVIDRYIYNATVYECKYVKKPVLANFIFNYRGAFLMTYITPQVLFLLGAIGVN